MRTNYCGVFLKSELKIRKEKNSFFSLRAFSRFLGISPTALSQCINHKRNLSRTNIEKFCKVLGVDERAKKFFLQDVKRISKSDQKEEKVYVDKESSGSGCFQTQSYKNIWSKVEGVMKDSLVVDNKFVEKFSIYTLILWLYIYQALNFKVSWDRL